MRALLLGIVAGTVFGTTSALTKAFVHELGDGLLAVLRHWEPYALAVLLVAGLTLLNSAYQAGALSFSLPAVEAAEPIVGVVLGITLLQEHLDVPTAAEKLLVVLAVLVVGIGILVLTRSESELATGAPGADPEPTGARSGHAGPGPRDTGEHVLAGGAHDPPRAGLGRALRHGQRPGAP